MAAPYDEEIGDSAEHIAFRLLEIIMTTEKKSIASGIERQWLLDAYGECLATVRGTAHSPVQSGRRRPA
jgi:hypothetical protein